MGYDPEAIDEFPAIFVFTGSIYIHMFWDCPLCCW